MAGSIALVVAAGRGRRVGSARPKQYLPLRGKPLLAYSMAAFAGLDEIGAVCVAIHPDDRPLYEDALKGLSPTAAGKLLEPVGGGATRQGSVHNGLENLARLEPDIVLIHDAARPLVDAGVIRRTMAALDRADGAVAALPVSDTLKRAEGPEGALRSAGTLERGSLWRAQTPQTFRFAAILEAHRKAVGRDLTDDAAVAEEAGLEVALVAGSEENLKVTTAEDLVRAEKLLGGRMTEFRVGLGFDVHRFGPGNKVMLCGVALPHDRGLSGHSDADVGLHALTDAILGALGEGDIGSHFPPGDPEWRDADSAIFARRALELVEAAGGEITHLDLTILCEEPKIGPYRDAMKARVAEILGLARNRVSIKATTTEGMGFLGRGEGIAAQATATLLLPAAAPTLMPWP